MNTRQKAISAFLVILTIVAAVIALQGDAKPTTVASSSQTSPKIGVALLSESCNLPAIADASVTEAGFTAAQFTVGKGNFNLSLPGATQRGNGNFSSKPLTTSSELKDFLNGNDQATAGALQAYQKQFGATLDQIKNPGNWIGVQYLTPVTWPGNTEFTEGSVRSAGSLNPPAGDIEWLFVDPSSCLPGSIGGVHLAWLRGACGNVELVPPKPIPPTPPCQECVTTVAVQQTTTDLRVPHQTPAPPGSGPQGPTSSPTLAPSAPTPVGTPDPGPGGGLRTSPVPAPAP